MFLDESQAVTLADLIRGLRAVVKVDDAGRHWLTLEYSERRGVSVQLGEACEVAPIPPPLVPPAPAKQF